MPICFESGSKLYCLFLLAWHESWPTCLYVEFHFCLYMTLLLCMILWTQFSNIQKLVRLLFVSLSWLDFSYFSQLLWNSQLWHRSSGFTWHSGSLVLPDTLTPILYAKVMHHLVLLHSGPQKLALTPKLEHSEGRKCVSVNSLGIAHMQLSAFWLW